MYSADNNITYSTNNGGFAEARVTLAEGVYTVFWYARGNGNTSDSFFVSLDNEAPKAVNTETIGWNHKALFSQIPLTAGEHIIRIYPREDGTALKYIGISLTHAYY